MHLSKKHCLPCQENTPCLTQKEWQSLLDELNGWMIADKHKLVKTYKLKNFSDALELANKIGVLADKENHHPDLLVRWGELKIELWTHRINGLSENDFILAAKIDQLNANSN